MECKNCGEALHGAYCGACGQKIITERITIRYIFSELFNIVTNFDHGLWHTIKMMFVAPGELIRNYLNGQTRRYYHPLRFLIFMIAISVAINLGLGVYDRQQSEIQSMVGAPQSEEIVATQQQLNQEIKKYLNFIPMIMIPVLALFSYLFFRKQPWNYAEHLVMHSFMQGQFALIGVPVALLSAFLQGQYTVHILLIVIGIGIIYGAYVFRQFFQINTFQAFIKYFFTYFISYIMLMLLSSIAMIIYLIASGKIQ